MSDQIDRNLTPREKALEAFEITHPINMDWKKYLLLQQDLDLANEKIKILKEAEEALKEMLCVLVGYKKYIPAPYKINPIYIVGSHEAEKKAIDVLKKIKAME